MRAVAVLLALLAVLSACTAAPAPDEWAGLGDPVADPHEPAPPQPQPRPVDDLRLLIPALAQEVAAGGGQAKPAEVTCSTATIVERFTCQVTYLEHTVVYTVVTAPDRSTSAGRAYNWRAEPDALVATATGIHAELWHDYAARASAIRCEWIPAAQLVAPDQPMQEHCWFKPIVQDPAYGRETPNHTRTVRVDIVISQGGIDFREVTQNG